MPPIRDRRLTGPQRGTDAARRLGALGTGTALATAALLGGLLASPTACEPDHGHGAPANTGLNPATHGPRFPIADGTHAGIDCNSCHGEFDTFGLFNCAGAGCHGKSETDSLHGGIPDYAHESPRCFDCHPSGKAGEGSAANHELNFPIDPASEHTGQACTSCHINPGQRTEVGCSSSVCHEAGLMAGVHDHVGGYAVTGLACISCHADAQVDEIADHNPFQIDGGPHHRKPCGECHPGRRTDKPWGIDFASLGCDGSRCHSRTEMDDKHKEMPSYAFEPTSCLMAGCHPDGRKE